MSEAELIFAGILVFRFSFLLILSFKDWTLFAVSWTIFPDSHLAMLQGVTYGVSCVNVHCEDMDYFFLSSTQILHVGRGLGGLKS